MKITDALKERLIFFDGAMGTELQKAGLGLGELPELLNIDAPDIILNVHRSYLKAGCDVVTANTFGANRPKLSGRLEEVIAAGVSLARRAADESEGQKWVALDIGPTGKLLKPLGQTSFEEAYEMFSEIVRAGAATGKCDLILIETMADLYETKAAVLAAKENCDLPVFCTMTFDENKKTLTGGSSAAMTALLEGLGADVIGINCGLGPAQAGEVFEELLRISSTPLMLQPNAGMPVFRNGETSFDVTAEEFARLMAGYARKGARVLGGCCGTTPEHIRRLKEACEGVSPVPAYDKDITLVSSYSKCVRIGGKPVIIGERINPTGKKKFKEALRNNDIGYILREAVTQDDCGAHILDVNVGLPEIDEVKMLKAVTEELQSVTNLPLQLDSTDADALEAALRVYNGKAMINSVNGKREVMDKIFPLVKKYGGVVVGLCLDEDGIPDTAEGRADVARRIIEEAAKYGIKKKDIVIDTLTLTVSAEQSEALRTLDALYEVKEKLGVNTVLGVSNVSFGLPRREIINSAFFTLALSRGLDACIINPCSEDMMRAYRAYCVLSGKDENCAEYVSIYAGTVADTKPAQTRAGAVGADAQAGSLFEIVIKGLKSAAPDAARKELEEKTPMEIIEGILIPALDTVGRGFEEGTIFLPQLIMSAETVKGAFGVIKEHMSSSGETGEPRGRIVLATVKGDIHDIGKNIVKVVLENYGYEVIDLGRDVDPEIIVETVKRENIRLLGLSALMTTTVVSMEETISRLKEAGAHFCRVMVGGAVLTEEYAKKAGADFYARDAMESVRFAKEVFKA
ncbi:MAG: homocysteine S-methyltransferase family protein [Clostridia bacterium]|nr:homocysteine S-methyltransferase family protein [Clostridia bacterium]